MQRFTGKQMGSLIELLSNAFDPTTFDQLLLARLGKIRYQITPDAAFPTVITNVVLRANQELWHLELLLAATAARPRDVDLGRLSESFIETSAAKSNLEALYNAAPFWDPAQLRARMVEIENHVCRIEMNTAFEKRKPRGTGFLVGADRVITNYHVVKDLCDGQMKSGDVFCHFDYKKIDGNSSPGVVIGLHAEKPVLSHRGYSEQDTKKTPLTHDWGARELDYAILQLERSPGDDPPGPLKEVAVDPKDEARGWEVCSEATAIDKSEPLFIWQHPNGDTVKYTAGRTLDPCLNAGSSRIRYTTNSLPGASGSPCFNSELRWIALHHAGDPEWKEGYGADYNQGIPAGLVVAACKEDGVVLS